MFLSSQFRRELTMSHMSDFDGDKVAGLFVPAIMIASSLYSNHCGLATRPWIRVAGRCGEGFHVWQQPAKILRQGRQISEPVGFFGLLRGSRFAVRIAHYDRRVHGFPFGFPGSGSGGPT